MRLRQLRAFVHAALHQLADFFELRPRIDRADVGVLVQRIADAQRLDAVAQFLDDRGIDSFLHEQPRTRATNMTLIKINSVDDTFDGLINRCVLEQNVRRLSAEFERELLLRARDRLRDALADLGAAGERELVYVRMINERRAGLCLLYTSRCV